MNGKCKRLWIVFVSALLAACGGGGMSGTYAGGMGSITFDGDKADIRLMGSTREMDYSVDGNKIVLHSAAAGDLVLTRRADGSIDTPWGRMRQSGQFGGHYRASDGSMEANFDSGTATFSTAGSPSFHAPYQVVGNQITVHTPQGALVLTRRPDGSLQGKGMPGGLIPVD